MIQIDGAMGEGGGQVLRTSLTLSAVTGQAVRMTNIRANRSKPGLMRQHLTAVRAAATICDATVDGDNTGSVDVTFRPGKIVPGEYHFSVGTAGSANLVLQTVLPALATAAGRSSVTIEGGTHNPASPPFEFVTESYLPTIAKTGHRFDASIESYGFYPAGGGKMRVAIEAAERPKPLSLLDRGEETGRELDVLVSNLPSEIARHELEVAGKSLRVPVQARKVRAPASPGPGNVLLGKLHYEHTTAVFAQFGMKGVGARTVASQLSKTMRIFAGHDIGVSNHLADQLLVPMALGAGGEFTLLQPSRHASTNADVISMFLGPVVRFEETETARVFRCRVGS